MQVYIAHYKSPVASSDRFSGIFEFESAARANSKKNIHDARLRMLELYGKQAASWTIESIDIKRVSTVAQDGQLAFDFRPQKKKKRLSHKKEYW